MVIRDNTAVRIGFLSNQFEFDSIVPEASAGNRCSRGELRKFREVERISPDKSRAAGSDSARQQKSDATSWEVFGTREPARCAYKRVSDAADAFPNPYKRCV